MNIKDRIERLENEVSARKVGRTDHSLCLLPMNVKHEVIEHMPQTGSVDLTTLPVRPEVKQVLDEWADQSTAMLQRVKQHLGPKYQDSQWFHINRESMPPDVQAIVDNWESQCNNFPDRQSLLEWLEANHEKLDKHGLLSFRFPKS